MSIKKILKSKKLWIVLMLLGIGVLAYYLFFDEEIITEEEKREIEEQYKGDTIEPYSKIQSLSSSSWKKENFQIKVLDEDLGGSGIKEDSCQYKVVSYGLNNEEIYSGWKTRKCNSLQTISVGPEGKCRFEGEDSCYVYVRSQDKAGNWSSPSKRELSIKSYNIDWTEPYVGKVTIDEENHKATIETTDSFKIKSCLLYIDGENQGTMNFLDSKCNNQCLLEKYFVLVNVGPHNIYAYCKDRAGNWGKGEVSQIIINTPPEISYCKSLPTLGNINTEIQFTVKVEDIDNDILSFLWDFGDETFSQEKNPTHSYSKTGTYQSSVTVSDEAGEDKCLTAWVTIVE